MRATVKKMKSAARGRRGSMLLEATIGLMMVVTSMGGAIALVSRAFQESNNATQKLVAANLAAEGIELAKYHLDADWDAVRPGAYELTYECPQPSCMDPIGAVGTASARPLLREENGTYGYLTGTPSAYVRTVAIDWEAESAKVSATVSWTDISGRKSLQIADTFWRWRHH